MSYKETKSSSLIDTSCIGFIGLGMMGFPTVKNLLAKGYKVIIYDLKREKIDALIELGAIEATSIEDLSSQATTVFTMVTGPEAVENIYLASNGLLKNLKKKKAYLFESSTIGYTTAELIRKAADEADQIFLDCPISGGTPGANAGTLTFMVGAKPEEFDAVKDFLSNVGKLVFHAGPPSTAQIIKICNNMSFAINMMGSIESYKMLTSFNADPQTFTDITNNSTGGSFVTKVYSPHPGVTPNAPSNNDYKGGYSLDLALKDMHIGQKIAKEKGISMPLLEKAIELYEKVQQKGLGHLDFSISYKYLD